MSLIGDNLRGLVCLFGAGWLYYGIAGWSVPAANTFGGALVLSMGLYPYVYRKRS